MQKFKLLYADFPESLRGNLRGGVIRHKGHILIVVDSTQPEPDQDFTLRHELAHLVLNHFEEEYQGDGLFIDNGFYVSAAQEAEANEYAERMTDAELSQLMEYAEDIKRVGAECLPLFTQNGIS